MHERLDGVGMLRSGKFFFFCLLPLNGRQRQILLTEVGVYLQHLLRTLFRFSGCLVYGMSLLPEEFTGAQERTGFLLPPDHAAPLVVKSGQIFIGMHILRIKITEERFGGRSNTKALI